MSWSGADSPLGKSTFFRSQKAAASAPPRPYLNLPLAWPLTVIGAALTVDGHDLFSGIVKL